MSTNYTQPLSIPILGMTPRPAYPANKNGQSNLENWRKFIVRQARAKYDKSLIQGVGPKTEFKVTMQFRLTKANFGADLDNLVKPVQDSLFTHRSLKFQAVFENYPHSRPISEYVNDNQSSLWKRSLILISSITATWGISIVL
ncbi:hypothetical protein [Ktedonobacter racemifer]|uniref:Uncharacterized protein n=1 Tax=Ktedonobacter racemifer DSM 44963 TaxID=485913 RepID=D6TPX3_KTERA|nr:hypothetical protein [Ktedonobacter racemifer]EFH87558.1 hypothetical protein Krac_8893 [Ktedonobacter racemifer DSM 44963]